MTPEEWVENLVFAIPEKGSPYTMNRVGVFSSPPVLDKSVGTVEATGMFCELRGEGVIGFMVATNDLEKTKASLKSFLANVIRYYVKHWPEHDWEDHV